MINYTQAFFNLDEAEALHMILRMNPVRYGVYPIRHGETQGHKYFEVTYTVYEVN